jgi:hypothetical protein
LRGQWFGPEADFGEGFGWAAKGVSGFLRGEGRLRDKAVILRA